MDTADQFGIAYNDIIFNTISIILINDKQLVRRLRILICISVKNVKSFRVCMTFISLIPIVILQKMFTMYSGVYYIKMKIHWLP